MRVMWPMPCREVAGRPGPVVERVVRHRGSVIQHAAELGRPSPRASSARGGRRPVRRLTKHGVAEAVGPSGQHPPPRQTSSVRSSTCVYHERIHLGIALHAAVNVGFALAVMMSKRYAVEQTRLGIPVVVHEESTGGDCARGATVFPQAIGLAATWDPEFVEDVASVIRERWWRSAPATRSRRCSTSPATPVGPGRGDLRRGPRARAARSARRTCAACRPTISRRRDLDRQALPRLRDVGGRHEPRARCSSGRASCGRCTPSRSRPRSAMPAWPR